MFLSRKVSVLPLERVVDVLDFPAFGLQVMVLLPETPSLVPEEPVRTLEAVVLSLEGHASCEFAEAQET